MRGGGGMCGVGVCVVGEGIRGGGHVWQGGMHGRGACVEGGLRGMHGRGHAWHAHPLGRYYGYGIRSMSMRYASYWNAFLFKIFFFIFF